MVKIAAPISLVTDVDNVRITIGISTLMVATLSSHCRGFGMCTRVLNGEVDDSRENVVAAESRFEFARVLACEINDWVCR